MTKQMRQFGANRVRLRRNHDKCVRRPYLAHCFGKTRPGTDAVDQKRSLDVGHGPVGRLNPHQATLRIDGGGRFEAAVVIPAHGYLVWPLGALDKAVPTRHFSNGHHRGCVREERDNAPLHEAAGKFSEVARLGGVRSQARALECSRHGQSDVPPLVQRDGLGQIPHLHRAECQVLVRKHLLPGRHLADEPEAPVSSRPQALANAVAQFRGQVGQAREAVPEADDLKVQRKQPGPRRHLTDTIQLGLEPLAVSASP